MAPVEDLNLPMEKVEDVAVAEVVEREESETGTDMVPVEDLNLPVETKEKVEKVAVADVTEQEESETGTEVAPVEDLNLSVEKVEEVAAVAEDADPEVVAELVKEESSATPEVTEVLSQQPATDEAVDTLAVTTVESVIESVITESVDTSSAVEAVIDIEDTECRNRDSTFLTEIEDTKDVHTDNVTEQESANNLNQLEKCIEESEKDFPIVESIGEIEEETPPMEDKCADIEESIEEGECIENVIISDDFKENVIKAKEEEIQNETEFIEPIESALAEKEIEAEADLIADKPSIENITEDTINTEKIPIFTLAMVAYVVFMALFVIVCY